ncbi:MULTISPECIES: hypothetical protein [unclassified Paenibacillus]|uniref:hypothetical protein n=1 Tax=unclassified Paenibacillus TaxID=185978 RepID=UPI00020D66A7|nr:MULTISPECIES: hypothetical protein [unclassified Paenibacillus]EGL17281.1 hypothetical protein HMPREF9413_3130 [Paenibacillus sp. HGF7]
MNLNKVIEGIAISNQVRTNQLFSEIQIINSLFTRIMENDFITAEHRSNILRKLEKLSDTIEEDSVTTQIETDSKKSAIGVSSLIQIVIALTASISGVIVAVFPGLGNVDGLISKFNSYFPAIVVFIISLVIIAGIFTVFKLKDTPIERESHPALLGLQFEDEVIKNIRKVIPDNKLDYSDSNKDVDLIINHPSKKIIIEVKYWLIKPNIPMVKRMVSKFVLAKQRLMADELIIVSNKPIDFRISDIEDDVKFFTLKELIKYLKQLK